jgi:uncharacterized protein (DUF697 family)
MIEKDKTKMYKEGDSIIRNHMIWAMGAGFIPIPIADFFAVSAIQLDMIRQLSKLYGIDFKQSEGKALITSLTGSGMARLGARAVKFIPGVGSVLGGVTMSVLSGATTYALGEVFKKHFETGGTFLDFDPARLKKFYDEKFEKGKDLARELQKQKEVIEKEQDINSKIAKIKEINELKASGAISNEEFEQLKKEILG